MKEGFGPLFNKNHWMVQSPSVNTGLAISIFKQKNIFMPDLRCIQTEVDASYLYSKLAEKEEDKNVADIFQQMSDIEKGHAEAFLKKVGLPPDKMPPPSFRAKTLNRIGKIFGYDYDSYKLILENCKNKSELNTLFEDEKNKVEKLKEAIHNYKAEYYIKWEKVNNQNVDEDWLEEKGFIDKNETDEVKHKNAWIKYFIENLSNRELIEILIYEFSGQMDEYEDINNKNSVKKFLEQIEKELKEYKDKIVQNYLISDSRLEKSNDDNTVGKKPKKRWSRNKSEFARFVQETYEKNKNDYKSLRDAAYKLFGDYEFEDKKWTKEKCYDLARQT